MMTTESTRQLRESVLSGYHAADFVRRAWSPSKRIGKLGRVSFGLGGFLADSLPGSGYFTEPEHAVPDDTKQEITKRIYQFLNAGSLAHQVGELTEDQARKYEADALNTLGEGIWSSFEGYEGQHWQGEALLEGLREVRGREEANRIVLMAGFRKLFGGDKEQSLWREVARGDSRICMNEKIWKKHDGKLEHRDPETDVITKTEIDVRSFFSTRDRANNAFAKMKNAGVITDNAELNSLLRISIGDEIRQRRIGSKEDMRAEIKENMFLAKYFATVLGPVILAELAVTARAGVEIAKNMQTIRSLPMAEQLHILAVYSTWLGFGVLSASLLGKLAGASILDGNQRLRKLDENPQIITDQED